MGSVKREKRNKGVAGLIKRVPRSDTVDVGIIDAGKHDDSDETVAEIGYKNEFGTDKIPSRPFFRLTVVRTKKKLSEMKIAILKKIQLGEMDKKTGLGLLGDFFRGELQQTIVDLDTPPNAALTIMLKGSSNPLIDTGQLKNSITYVVNE